ncbi:MAG: tail fiber protein [Pseudomonadota bacterium]
MTEPFIGQIAMFGGTFAPRGWTFCDGQLLSISQFSALFSLIGTTYGGNGETTFGLPDLKGRSPIHEGTGSGLTQRRLGQKGGTETVTLTADNLPTHGHALKGQSARGRKTHPGGRSFAQSRSGRRGGFGLYDDADNTSALSSVAVTGGGAGAGHNNVQPVAVVNFIIALEGLFPSSN